MPIDLLMKIRVRGQRREGKGGKTQQVNIKAICAHCKYFGPNSHGSHQEYSLEQERSFNGSEERAGE